MNIKLNTVIIVLFSCHLIYLSACAGKQYDIELLPAAPEATDISELDTVHPEEDLPAESPNIPDDENLPDAPCYVHICGAVAKPGVYELPAGSRIFELLTLAGGFSEDAATDAVNLAMPVIDGSKVQIPTVAEMAAQAPEEQEWVSVDPGNAGQTSGLTGSVNQGTATDAQSALVNINTATADALMSLPGIGKSKADSIIAYREEKGKFSRVEDIMNITGIKEGVFNKIKDMICV